MLSRRNIRIKVMQMLYAASRDQNLEFKEVLRRYNHSIDASYELYLFNIYQLISIAQYAVTDLNQRSSKYLPTEEDKKFTAKLFNNDLVQSIFKSEEYNQLIHKYKFPELVDKDNIRTLYSEFVKDPKHTAFIEKDMTNGDTRQVLLDLYKKCLNNELFTDLLDDAYPNWIDDKSLVIGTVKKSIKALPAGNDFFIGYKPTDETTLEFGETLLENVFKRDKEFLEHIEPTLKNWDVERVAVLDMILLKMALCELLIFPTIPTKVTLNEFVEISKLYSTEKSKDFINGILDRLMKKLHKEGRIKKEGRGLLE